MYSIDIDGCPDAELDYVIASSSPRGIGGRGRRRGSTRRSSPRLGSATSAAPTAGRTSAGTGKWETASHSTNARNTAASRNVQKVPQGCAYPIVDAIRPYIVRLKPAYLKENHQVFEADKKGAVVLGQTSVRSHCEQFSKQAGLKPIRLHEFRHSCVSSLLMHGISPRLVARWVGDTESMVLST